MWLTRDREGWFLWGEEPYWRNNAWEADHPNCMRIQKSGKKQDCHGIVLKSGRHGKQEVKVLLL